jgi:predicted site-specific integrase-resolvase
VLPGDLYGPKEAAAFLGRDRTTITRWNRDGYMPAPFQELGGAPVWTRAALEEFRDRHAAASDAAGRRPLGTATR